jgi:hypothetical protein
VQFAAQGKSGMRIETTSNSYLPKQEQLNEQQIAALIQTGWNAPTGNPDEATPELDPQGSPNYYADLPVPVPFKKLAKMTARTLSEILRVPHPGYLEYTAMKAKGEVIDLPELGLRPEKLPSVAQDSGDFPIQ